MWQSEALNDNLLQLSLNISMTGTIFEIYGSTTYIYAKHHLKTEFCTYCNPSMKLVHPSLAEILVLKDFTTHIIPSEREMKFDLQIQDNKFLALKFAHMHIILKSLQGSFK